MRTTIDYGIDLGTTNSSIALLEGTEVKVFENNEGQNYTPSVVWLDKKERLYVGRRAKNQLECDPDNAFSEFKLQMGTSQLYTFKRSGRAMKPEDLSAEVLKSLRDDVRQRNGEQIAAAVITVPAAFELPQCEATARSARLAGLTVSPLLQEPVAAALAYGFQSESDRTFWLVYDIGGGTFDAAIIHLRDGSIQVVNHGGDNHLGGKLIDWEIVDQLLAPALRREHRLSDFERGNERWRAVFAKLKLHAEEAKIQLSRDEATQIYIDPLCQDDRGDWVQFDYELRRRDIEPLVEPYIERSINICKRVMAEENLGPDDIAKVLLVGGPTLNPMVREILSSRLKIELDYRIDPLTVVSRGAAVFAGTQRLQEEARPVMKTGQYFIHLEYKPIDNDPEPLVAGKVEAPDEDMSCWTIEFVESKSQWRSGLIQLTPHGAFMTSLRAERGRPNEFLIELRDGEGRLLEIMPDRFTYTLGATISAQPLIHSIGVALANNEVRVFMEKGCDLPARRREVFRTTTELKKGETGTFLRIPVVEGEDRNRADRNRLIGNLVVTGGSVRRDMATGSEIEITVVVDESRRVHTLAYIPVLDEEYEEVLQLEKPEILPADLAYDAHIETERLHQLEVKVQQLDNAEALAILDRLERERMMHDIESSLAASPVDRDAADKCQSRLLDLKRALDDIEYLIEWPELVEKANQLISQTRAAVDAQGNTSLRPLLTITAREIEEVIENHDTAGLKQKIKKMHEIHTQVLAEDPGFWVEYFNYLCDKQGGMRDTGAAEKLIAQGKQAIQNNNLDGLETAVRRLVTLLPVAEQTEIRDLRSTVMPRY
ncbi:MAG: Hsp70 family protein [bacterium]